MDKTCGILQIYLRQMGRDLMPDDLLTAQEAADYLKLKKNTVYEMIKRGEIPSAKIGKQLRIALADLEALLPSGAVVHTPRREEMVVHHAPEGGHDSVVLCGQDACLDLIANHVTGQAGNKAVVLRSHAGSYNSLTMLYHGKVDIATAHLWHEKTASYNLPYLEALLPGMPAVAVRLFGRMTGIYVQRGNPKGIQSLEDLRRRDVTLVNREKGSGTRVLLDEKLKVMGLARHKVNGYLNEQTNHMTVAAAVARGDGDLGLGAQAASMQVSGVEFIPIQREWYDMVFLAERERDAAIQAILSYVLSQQFIQDLSQNDGYDLSQTGRVFRL